jgi:hypothetical protein
MSPSQSLLELLHGNWATQALYAAAELKLADLLIEGPKTSDELAAATQVHAGSLRRLLRALATIDVVRELPANRFELTATGQLLADNTPDSLRHWVIWWGHNLWPVWGNLIFSIKTGRSARTLLTGSEGFGHLERDPATADVFNKAMAELTTLAATDVVGAYDFTRFRQIVDVGGGHGQLLAAILRASPSARGILVDLPHAIEGATRYLHDAGLSGRAQCIAGDFFEAVPGGCDAYVLKSVIHDWDDQRASRILENCRRAMPGNSRLILVERIMPTHLDSSMEHRALARTDLSMLVALGAGERSEADFRALLSSAGFELGRLVTTEMAYSLIEALPR